VLPHPGEQRVTAARDQAEKRRLERIGLQEVGSDVAVKMVDRDQRFAVCGRHRLRGTQPDQQGANQAGALGDGDRLDLGELDSRLLEGSADDCVEQLKMMSGSDLGHDAPIALVELSLGGDDVGEDPRPIDDGGAGVVAGRLEGQDHRRRHMITAFSPLSW
jgi:hypothetical protein